MEMGLRGMTNRPVENLNSFIRKGINATKPKNLKIKNDKKLPENISATETYTEILKRFTEFTPMKTVGISRNYNSLIAKLLQPVYFTVLCHRSAGGGKLRNFKVSNVFFEWTGDTKLKHSAIFSV